MASAPCRSPSPPADVSFSSAELSGRKRKRGGDDDSDEDVVLEEFEKREIMRVGAVREPRAALFSAVVGNAVGVRRWESVTVLRWVVQGWCTSLLGCEWTLASRAGTLCVCVCNLCGAGQPN